MNDQLNYYAILEVRETASPDEIKRAFRHLAKEYHPDRVPAHLTKLKKDAEERFKQINEAYQVLSTQWHNYDDVYGCPYSLSTLSSAYA